MRPPPPKTLAGRRTGSLIPGLEDGSDLLLKQMVATSEESVWTINWAREGMESDSDLRGVFADQGYEDKKAEGNKGGFNLIRGSGPTPHYW